MRFQTLLALFFALACIAVQAKKCPKYKVKIFTATSRKASGLNKIIELYTNTLGGIDNGNNPGPLPDGQRSINWDAAAVPFDFPGNFFDVTVTRGALFETKGNKFAVSNTDNSTDIDDRFNTILPGRVSRQFRQFSPLRLFIPITSNKVHVLFKIPARDQAATVTGFGAVFTDVDRKKGTFMEYFDKRGCSIVKVFVPPRGKGLSFTGVVVFGHRKGHKLIPVIAKVLMKLGTVSVKQFLKKHSGDLVAVDDLFYSEPQKKWF